jgi:hypothetical protein
MDLNDSTFDILPDSRLKDSKGAIRMQFATWGFLNMVPLFCANCGKLGAYVPEENCTFAIWLCDSPCAEQWGPQYGLGAMPDEVFWQKVQQEQMERYGRFLTTAEMQTLGEASCNPIATLLKESPIRS